MTVSEQGLGQEHHQAMAGQRNCGSRSFATGLVPGHLHARHYEGAEPAREGSALLASAGVDLGRATASEQVYAKLLKELTQRDDGVQTRVVVDVIAGTSAGGINGICLAKALAHNRSQDELRTLWFDHGDIDGLLNAPSWLKKRGPKLAWVAMHALKREPLKGEVMAQWVYDAFQEMDAQQPQPAQLLSLLPDKHKLELFVTVTDFAGYGRQVPFTDPNPILDTRHRHLLAFRYDGEDGRMTSPAPMQTDR
jgi:hypothetical protein